MKDLKIFKDYFDEYLSLHPLTASFCGIKKYDDKFPNYLDKKIEDKLKKFYKKYIKKINEINKSKINDRNAHFLKVLKWRMEDNLEGFNYKFDLLPLDQLDNFILDYVDYATGESYVELKTLLDFKNFLKRTQEFFIYCDTAIIKMEEGLKQKISHPKSIMKEVLKQLNDLLKTKDYVLPDKKIPKNIKEEYKEIMDEQFTEMVKKIRDFIKYKYIPNTHDGFGLSSIPGGKKMYKYLAKSHTTVDMDIKDIHNLGLKEIKRINKAIKELFENGNNSVNNSKKLLVPTNKNTKKFSYKNKEEVIKAYKEASKIIYRKIIPKYFDIRISHNYELKKVPEFKQEGNTGAYYMMGSMDGNRRGAFFLNTKNLDDFQTFNTFSLTMHEGNPGHHFQLTCANDNKIPDFITYTDDETSYVEGWALYAESLTHDYFKNSIKSQDIYSRYGCYNFELFRAVRLVVDTGINYYGWSFKKSFDFMKKYTVFSDYDIKSEINRYSVYSGQALSYKIGQIKFTEFRERYLKKYKNKDIKNYHREVLEYGSCPLSILEDKLNI